MPTAETTYEDSQDPLVVTCIRCTDGTGRPLPVTGRVRGTRDARSIIKELKTHVDRVHGDWTAQMPTQISNGIAEINRRTVRELRVANRFGLRRR